MILKVVAHNKKVPGCSILKIGREYEVVEHCGGYIVYVTPDKNKSLSVPRNQLTKLGEVRNA